MFQYLKNDLKYLFLFNILQMTKKICHLEFKIRKIQLQIYMNIFDTNFFKLSIF